MPFHGTLGWALASIAFVACGGKHSSVDRAEAGTSGHHESAGSGASASGSSGTSSAGATGGGSTGGAMGGGPAGGMTSTGGTAGTSGLAGTGAGGVAGTGGADGGMAGTGGADGGGAGAASCTERTPCGGDVVGTWAAVSCPLTVSGEVDVSDFGLGCSSGPVTGSLEVTGTLTLHADGSLSDNTVTTGEGVFELASECLAAAGLITCENVGRVLVTLGYASVTCVENESFGCTCQTTVDQSGRFAFVSPDASTSGTYVAADERLVTSASGSDTEYTYCVEGNTLTLSLESVAKTGTVTGPIVFLKQ